MCFFSREIDVELFRFRLTTVVLTFTKVSLVMSYTTSYWVPFLFYPSNKLTYCSPRICIKCIRIRVLSIS